MNSNYSITIKDSSASPSQQQGTGVAGSGASSANTGAGGAGGSASSGGASMSGKAALAKTMAVKIPIRMVDKIVTHRISLVSLETGAKEQQERLSFVYSMGKQVGRTALAVGTGLFLTGGNPLGALLGLSTSMLFTSLDYIQKSETINVERGLENVGLRFMNRRAGGSVAAFNGSRMR